MQTSQHRIPRITVPPEATARWDDLAWSQVAALDIASFHPKSSDHRPVTRLKLCYDDAFLYLLFRVEDRFVLAEKTVDNESVCRDSCVEAFIEPPGGRGYVNVETNACGVVLASHVTDPTWLPTGLRTYTLLTPEALATIRRSGTLTGPIVPERPEPVTWQMSLRIPFAIFTAATGAAAPRPGDVWRANFYKCADRCSHPHWSSWSPIGAVLAFHQPQSYGQIVFG